MKRNTDLPRLLLYLALFLILEASVFAQGVQKTINRNLPQLSAPTRVFQSKLLQVFAVSPVRKVFERDKPNAWGEVTPKGKIQLSLARNESEPFFLVLRPTAQLKNVKLTFKSATNRKATRELSWSYRRVAEVPVKGISKWYGMLGVETGTIPDPLLSDQPFTAKPNLNSVLLVEARTSSLIKPGVTAGSIQIEADGKTLAKIPVELDVWDIMLPRKPRMQTLTHNLERAGRASWTFLRNSGFTALKYGPDAPLVRLKKGELHIDFEKYKKDLDIVFNELGYDYVLVPPSLLGYGSVLSKAYLGLGITVGSKRFWPVFDQYMKQMGDFYRAHGWEDKVIFYMFDEVNPENHPLVIKLAKRAKLHYPKVKVMITTHVMTDELAGALDAWCVPWHFFATNPKHIPNWRKWQRNGLELWAYMNSLYTLNAKSSLGANRFYPSVMARYGFKGNFWWGIAHNAGKDPWQEIHRHGNLKMGMYANGLLFYPPRRKKTSAFEPWHASLRWESYRQGLDEFALMEMLGDSITQVRRNLGALAKDERFSKERLLHSWGSLLADKFRMQTYRRDVEFVHRFRQLLAHEIQTISKRPLGLIAVENLDGPIASSDVATIRGISQAGTTVKVAGRRMKTNVFRAKLRLRPGRNLIPVSFDDGKGNVKTLYREIEYRIPK